MENRDLIVHYTNEGSLWFNNIEEVGSWLKKQEAKRLELCDDKKPIPWLPLPRQNGERAFVSHKSKNQQALQRKVPSSLKVGVHF